MGALRAEANSDWVTASDLAEYAYCPRASWYRRHPPPVGPTSQSRRERVEGGRFHDREIGRRTRREQWSGMGWMLVGGGVLLLLLALLVVGHP